MPTFKEILHSEELHDHVITNWVNPLGKSLVNVFTIFRNYFFLHATLKVLCTKKRCSHVKEL